MLAAPPGAGGPRSGAPASAADAVTRVSTGCPITWRAGWPRGRCAVGPRVRAAPRRTAGPRARTPPAGRSAAWGTRGTVPCGVVPARHPGRRRRSRPASGSGPGTHPCPAGRPVARRPRGRRPPHGAPDPRGGDARDAPRGGRAGGSGHAQGAGTLLAHLSSRPPVSSRGCSAGCRTTATSAVPGLLRRHGGGAAAGPVRCPRGVPPVPAAGAASRRPPTPGRPCTPGASGSVPGPAVPGTAG